MKAFVLIFRSSNNPHANPSPEQMQARKNWMDTVVAQDKLVDNGNRTSVKQAKTVKAGNVIADGPYTANQEFVTGYMLIKANTIEEVVELAKTNPILKGGGIIEIRAVLAPGELDQ